MRLSWVRNHLGLTKTHNGYYNYVFVRKVIIEV